jgi:hypothetical protein
MTPAAPGQVRAGGWWGLAVFLLAWNGLAATYAGQFTLIQGYDGAQYQLLARNRLHGRPELGDTAHTVRLEGCHPMWRPGLVWLTEGLARLSGSVRTASAVASALGTSLLEWTLLWLAWRCFGVGTCGVVFLCLVLPLTVSSHFIRLAVGQGPEPWATALVLVGLAALVEGLRKRSFGWAALAGLAAGASEWFRTGNLVLFAVPCGVYALAGLRQGGRRGVALPATALTSFMVMAAAGGLALPSRVDKTAANLWGNLVEEEGLKVKVSRPGAGTATLYLGGLMVAPGTAETYYDYIVRRCHEVTARDLAADRAGQIVPLYFRRLGDVAAGGCWGLRMFTGDLLLVFFFVQVGVSLIRRRPEDIAALAFAAGAMAYYLGPVVLLRGDEPTHYLMVLMPLVLLVGARGVVETTRLLTAALERRRPGLAAKLRQARKPLAALALAPVLCVSVSFYQGALETLADHQEESGEEQADLNALNLQGKRVVCRNMCWFSDIDAETILLPYATVPELENYVRANRADGVLIWTHEKQLLFKRTPYRSFRRLDRAFRDSPVFGSPVVSGGWRWYPVRQKAYSGGSP